MAVLSDVDDTGIADAAGQAQVECVNETAMTGHLLDCFIGQLGQFAQVKLTQAMQLFGSQNGEALT